MTKQSRGHVRAMILAAAGAGSCMGNVALAQDVNYLGNTRARPALMPQAVDHYVSAASPRAFAFVATNIDYGFANGSQVEGSPYRLIAMDGIGSALGDERPLKLPLSPMQVLSQAQAAAPNASPSPGSAQADASPAKTAVQATPEMDSDAEQSVDDIIVTALRDGRIIQKTPAAVTVVDGEQISSRHILDIRDMEALVPAAKFMGVNTSTRIYIRGVGSFLDFYWVPELTALNINDVYLPRFATSGSMFDVESVQVLPGPQGVLYGRGAGGGAVLVNTRRPLNKTEASVSFDYGNYDMYRLEGMFNAPIADDLAVRAAFTLSKRNGYQSFDQQSDDSFSVRLSALYRPNDDLSVFVWGTHFKQTGNPTTFVYHPFIREDNPWYIPANDPVTGLNTTIGTFSDFSYTIGGYEVKYELGDHTIEYIGSVLTQRQKAARKLFGNPQSLNTDMTQYTQKINVSGTVGSIDYIAGIDWFYTPSSFGIRFGPGLAFGYNHQSIATRGKSVFAQGTYHVTPTIRVVGGARYSHDSLSLEGANFVPNAPGGSLPVTFKDAWNHLDLKGGVEADLTPVVMVYANVQTGYAPGTLNTLSNIIAVDKEVRPQTLLAYTAGFKSRLFNDILTVNVEGFAYKYKDFIIQAVDPMLFQSLLYNVPSAKVYGAQLDSQLKVGENGALSLSVGYTHGAYKSFKSSPNARDLNGLQMVYTPTWSGDISYKHRFELARGAVVDAQLGTYFSSSYWGTFDHSSAARQPSYTKSHASLTYRAADDRWRIGVWMKNIENEPVASALGASGFAAPYHSLASLQPPRTYGVTLGLKM